MKENYGLSDVAAAAAWPAKGDFVFACGSRDGVLTRCPVERVDAAGASFFSERKYVPGEEVGLQFNAALGRNEFGPRVLTGRIKSCRSLRGSGGATLCRAEASWVPAGSSAWGGAI